MTQPVNPPVFATEALLDGIRGWVLIESPTTDPAAVNRMVDRVQAEAVQSGLRTVRTPGRDGYGDHLLVEAPWNTDAPGILLLSHLDTVHPTGTLAGKLPFRVEGDAAFGPGIYDMKGGTVIALAALIVVQIPFLTSMGFAAATGVTLAVLAALTLLPAMLGKILPYTVVFLLILGLSDVALYGWLAVPLRGSLWLMALGAVLFVLASQMIGALAFVLSRDMGRAASLIAIITAPAFGFMGLGFPREAMSTLAQAWGAAIPGTWYVQLRIDQSLRATPLDISAMSVLWLAVIAGVLATLPRSRKGRTMRLAVPSGSERGLDVRGDLLRLGRRPVALEHGAVPPDQELGEVPLDGVAQDAGLLPP